VAQELEIAAAGSLPHLGGHSAPPAHGSDCANCGAALQGPYCHVCGQNFDGHKRSILHLTWEAIEGLFHLDGRLLRTLPDLFLRPGRLARDYMEGRIARHVPPFRTFLVALLLFIFAAEHATHVEMTREAQRKAALAASLATPQGRAAEAARIRAEAAKEHAGDLADAAKDRADDLKDPDEDKAKVQAVYARALQKAEADYASALDHAERVAKGLPDPAPASAESAKPRQGWWREGLHKATDNPEYYLTVLFNWGHRAAALLLPIVGLSLAVVYRNKPRYFIYDHLVVAMNLLSFAFLTNALGLILPSWMMGWWFGLVAIWTPINLFQTLRGAYGSSVLGAVLKTLIVWIVSVSAFGVLLTGLMVFSLSQL
jgi:hypothetical protein